MNFILWHNGAEFGPYDLEAVQNSIQAGDISSKVLARLDTSSEWKPLEMILPKVAKPKTSAAIAIPNRGQKVECKCPQCGADTIRSLPLVHESGISFYSGRTTGGGVLAGGELSPVAMGTTSTGTTRTLLSNRFAPPVPKKMKEEYGFMALSICLGLLAVVCLFSIPSAEEDSRIGLLLGVAGCIGVGVVFLRVARANGKANKQIKHFNDNDFHALLADWKNGWLCDRCGYVGLLS